MSYYLDRTVELPFEEAEKRIREELEKEGFGIISEVNVHELFKKKLGVDFRKYKILGACNPRLAYNALEKEDKIGVLLPCNVVLQEKGPDLTEIAAVDPMRSMEMIANPGLKEVAFEAQSRLKKALDEAGKVHVH